MPPIGGVFAAFGGPEAEAEWLGNIHEDTCDIDRTTYGVATTHAWS